MARLEIPTVQQAPAKAQPILLNYEKVLGVTPNFFALLSESPDALKAIADMHGALGKSLGHKTRERIHVMTAEVNGCNYCLSAHTYLGAKLQGLAADDLELNREDRSTDPKANAALQFAFQDHPDARAHRRSRLRRRPRCRLHRRRDRRHRRRVHVQLHHEPDQQHVQDRPRREVPASANAQGRLTLWRLPPGRRNQTSHVRPRRRTWLFHIRSP